MFSNPFKNKGHGEDLSLKSGTSQIPLQGLIQDYPDADTLFGANNYTHASKQGYSLNYVIHKIVDDISRMASNIPLTIEASPEVEQLLEMPEPGVGYKKWMKRAIAEKLLDGNAYAEIILVGKRITRLNQFRPDRVTIDRGSCDKISNYYHTCGGQKIFPVDPDSGIAEMFHTKFYNPLDTELGLSPVKAAFKSLTQNNEISRIHTAILKNDGAVKGFIGMKQPTKDGFAPAPGKEAMKDIRDQVNNILSGRQNRGKWAIFNWMFDFVKLGQTGQEMDWNKNKEATAREMAIALGYPAMLLGYADGSTFNNVESAENWLVLHTVLPILEEVLDDMKMMFLMHTGVAPKKLEPNEEEILAIQPIIREKRAAAREDFKAGVITDKEVRAEGGYEEITDGTIFMPSNVVPLGMDIAGLTALTDSNEDQA